MTCIMNVFCSSLSLPCLQQVPNPNAKSMEWVFKQLNSENNDNIIEGLKNASARWVFCASLCYLSSLVCLTQNCHPCYSTSCFCARIPFPINLCNSLSLDSTLDVLLEQVAKERHCRHQLGHAALDRARQD